MIKNQKGMTLVELMVAVVIISLIVITMFSIFNVGFSTISKSDQETQAIHLAQWTIEEIKLMLNTEGYYDESFLSKLPKGYEYDISEPVLLNEVWHIRVNILFDQNKKNILLETRLGTDR